MTQLKKALLYAASGLKIFPCLNKSPLTPHGYKDASSSREQIERWWQKYPDAQIGLPCGGNGLVVLDFDTYKPNCGGAIQEFEKRTEVKLSEHPYVVKSSRGGLHYYFKMPSDEPAFLRPLGIPGLDVITQGHYVIAADGDAYRLIASDAGLDPRRLASVPDLPRELIGEVPPTPKSETRSITMKTESSEYALAALDNECETLARVEKGRRNNELNTAAMRMGELIGGGELAWNDAAVQLLATCRSNGLIEEIGPVACMRTIESGLRHGMQNPRGKGVARTQTELKELAELPTVPLKSRVGFADRKTGALRMEELSKKTIEDVRKQFEKYEHFPSDDHWIGLTHIAKVIERMAIGMLVSNFYVSFLPPGMGKTTTLVESIRSLLQIADYSDVGAIIFLSRLEEITRLASGMGLTNEEFAVIASKDKEENRLGRQDDKTQARVLLTTQQGLEARSRGGAKFADMTEYFYKGKPRQVKVWDEAILPSATFTLSRFDITDLLSTINKERPDLIASLDGVCTRLDAAKDRTPFDFSDFDTQDVDVDEARSWFDDDAQKEKVEALWSMSGRTVRVRDDHVHLSALDYKDILPDDLAPMLILDASGQQRATYALWHHYRKGLKFLRSPGKSYDGFTIHHWDRGAGKSAFRSDWQTLVGGIAVAIKSIPANEKILVVHLKQNRHIPDLKQKITQAIGWDANRVQFCHWGVHTATNDYGDVKHVILAGVIQYRTSQYEATARAAKQMGVEEELTEEEYNDVRLGELSHHIFQATNRGMVRKSVRGGCPSGCHLYIILPTHKGAGAPQALLKRIFPDATVVDWRPVTTSLRGNQKKVFDLIITAQKEGAVAVQTATLRQQLGITDPSQLRKLLKHRNVVTGLKAEGVEVVSDGKQVQIRQVTGDRR